MTTYILDEKNNPVVCKNIRKWGRFMQDKKFQLSDQVFDGDGKQECILSTVFLGLDHRLIGSGPPLLFETMIFGGERNQEQHRTSTYAQAISLHDQILTELREELSTS